MRRNNQNMRVMTPEEFWAKVDINYDDDGCWPFRGANNSKGYGILYARQHGRVIHMTASRWAYRWNYGPFSPDLQILHRCDNRVCVRPSHLFLGTIADNMKDKCVKGRGGNKLTAEIVQRIRKEYAAGGTSMQKLAVAYGNDISNVQRIISRKAWRHTP